MPRFTEEELEDILMMNAADVPQKLIAERHHTTAKMISRICTRHGQSRRNTNGGRRARCAACRKKAPLKGEVQGMNVTICDANVCRQVFWESRDCVPRKKYLLDTMQRVGDHVHMAHDTRWKTAEVCTAFPNYDKYSGKLDGLLVFSGPSAHVRYHYQILHLPKKATKARLLSLHRAILQKLAVVARFNDDAHWCLRRKHRWPEGL